MNWLLIGVLAVIGLGIMHGYKSGFVKMLFSAVTFIITIVLVWMLAPTGAKMVKENEKIYQAIKAPVENLLDEKIDGQVKTEEVLDSCNIPSDVKENILSAAGKAGLAEVNVFTPEMKTIATDCIVSKLIDIMTYIVLFIAINIALRIVAALLNGFSRLPLIHSVNKLAGSLIGGAEGLVIVWIAFLIITIFSTTAWGGTCFDMIGDSSVLSVLYAYNLFLIFI